MAQSRRATPRPLHAHTWPPGHRAFTPVAPARVPARCACPPRLPLATTTRRAMPAGPPIPPCPHAPAAPTAPRTPARNGRRPPAAPAVPARRRAIPSCRPRRPPATHGGCPPRHGRLPRPLPPSLPQRRPHCSSTLAKVKFGAYFFIIKTLIPSLPLYINRYPLD